MLAMVVLRLACDEAHLGSARVPAQLHQPRSPVDRCTMGTRPDPDLDTELDTELPDVWGKNPPPWPTQRHVIALVYTNLSAKMREAA